LTHSCQFAILDLSVYIFNDEATNPNAVAAWPAP
jgi:hypothetical protein